MSSLQEVAEKDFADQVLQDGGAVLVDFWAPWCGPCRMLTPVLEKLSVKMKDRVKIVKLNTDENFEVARSYGIMAIPTLVLFRNGKESRRLTGFVPEKELETWIQSGLDGVGPSC